MQPGAKRIFGLDVLRALAILVVVMQHGTPMMHPESGAYIYLAYLVDGVDMFFVLSGFLIGNILIRTFMDGFTFRKLWIFLTRRWLRTMPLYYFFLLLNFIMSYYGLFPGTINTEAWWYLIFMQNFLEPLNHFYYESWSLTVEEWFYLLFAGGLSFLMLLPKLHVKYAVPVLWAGMIACGIITRYHYNDSLNDYYLWEIHLRKLALSRMDTIGWGILCAWTMNFLPSLWKRMIIIGPFITAGLLTLSILNKDNNTALYHGQLFFILNAMWITFLLPALNAWKKAPFPRFAFFTFTSKISYSMYLANLPVLYLSMAIFPRPLTSWYPFFIFLAFIYISSFITYSLIEKPFMRIRRSEAAPVLQSQEAR